MTATAVRPAPKRAPDKEPRWTFRGADRRREAIWAWLFVMPAAVLFVCFIAGPLIGALALSFFQWDLLSDPEAIGLANYKYLAGDGAAWGAIGNTLIFTVASVTLHIGLGLALAVAVNRKVSAALKYVVRTAFFFPLLVSWAVVAILAKYALDPNFGFLTYYLKMLGVTDANVFTQPNTAMAALVGVDVWRSTGFTFIVLLAGLQAIPRHIYEAAAIDGANAWHTFRYVTLPLLSPSLFFVTIISFIKSIQVFEPMFIITDGGPGSSTRSIVQYIYQVGFRQFHMGYASTLALLVFLIIVVLTGIQFKISRKWVHVDVSD